MYRLLQNKVGEYSSQRYGDNDRLTSRYKELCAI